MMNLFVVKKYVHACVHALLAISWWRCYTLSRLVPQPKGSCWTPVWAGLRSMKSDEETSPLVSLIGRDVFQSAAVPQRHIRWVLIKPERWCRIKAFIDPATHVQLRPAELSAPIKQIFNPLTFKIQLLIDQLCQYVVFIFPNSCLTFKKK